MHIIRKNKVLIVFMAALLLTGCVEVVEVKSCADVQEAGFWSGLWHGLIAPIAFIVSLFKDNVAIYAVCNNGGWYNFGFLLGASILLGGGGHRTAKSR